MRKFLITAAIGLGLAATATPALSHGDQPLTQETLRGILRDVYMGDVKRVCFATAEMPVGEADHARDACVAASTPTPVHLRAICSGSNFLGHDFDDADKRAADIRMYAIAAGYCAGNATR